MSYENIEDIDVSMVENPLSLSKSDLVEEYEKVYAYFLQQKTWIDKYRQEIHVLKKEKLLKENVLKDELQALSEIQEQQLVNYKKKYLLENEDLSNRLTEANNIIEKLQQDIEYKTNNSNAAAQNIQIISPPELKICDRNEIAIANARIAFLENIEINYLDEKNKIQSQISELISRVMLLEVIKNHSIFLLCTIISSNFFNNVPFKE